MAKGLCGLCKRKTDLRRSHFMPTAIYAYLRTMDDGTKSEKAPFVLDENELTRDFKQIYKPFLCNDCEGRFNTQGESWVLENCFRKPGEFQLQEMLLAGTHKASFPAGWILHADDFPKLRWEKLVYFAVSIFWRAGATTWTARGKRIFVPMPDRTERELRQYLLGRAALPRQAVVSVAVTSKREPPAQSMSVPTCDIHEGYHHYRFVIPGMIFDMLVGPNIPQIPRDHCLARGHRHPIYLLEDNRLVIETRARLLRTAVPSEVLRKEFLPPALYDLTSSMYPKPTRR